MLRHMHSHGTQSAVTSSSSNSAGAYGKIADLMLALTTDKTSTENPEKMLPLQSLHKTKMS